MNPLLIKTCKLHPPHRPHRSPTRLGTRFVLLDTATLEIPRSPGSNEVRLKTRSFFKTPKRQIQCVYLHIMLYVYLYICIILMYMIVYIKYKNHLFRVRQKQLSSLQVIRLQSPNWRSCQVPFQAYSPLPGSCLAHHLHILLAPEAVHR